MANGLQYGSTQIQAAYLGANRLSSVQLGANQLWAPSSTFFDTNFTTTGRPFQNSLFGTPLPDNATIDPNSATSVADLVTQVGIGTPTVNCGSWTSEPIVVPATQRLVPVTMDNTGDANLKAVLALGVPIPDWWAPTNDTGGSSPDWEGTFIQPDYVSPYDATIQGRYYELYHAYIAADGTWHCKTGARQYNTNNSTRPRFTNSTTGAHDMTFATDPDSTYSVATWGIQGSAIPLIPGILTKADCAAGTVNHAVCLEVVHSRNTEVWPAQRSDGDISTSGTTGYNVIEGQRYRFPPGYTIPATLHPMAQLYVQAIRDYGLIVTDRSGVVAFRAAPLAAPYLNGSPQYAVLNNFPWQDLQLLAVGSDTTQTPTS